MQLEVEARDERERENGSGQRNRGNGMREQGLQLRKERKSRYCFLWFRCDRVDGK